MIKSGLSERLAHSVSCVASVQDQEDVLKATFCSFCDQEVCLAEYDNCISCDGKSTDTLFAKESHSISDFQTNANSLCDALYSNLHFDKLTSFIKKSVVATEIELTDFQSINSSERYV